MNEGPTENTARYVNLAALEPLYAPHEEPSRHRVRAEEDGQPAKTIAGRRKTPIGIAQSLRGLVKAWRENDYPGASDTTRELLHHWFQRDHFVTAASGERAVFRYFDTAGVAGSKPALRTTFFL